MMALPFDTTLHYVAVHMHPFAESLELRDVTADRSLFKSHVRNLSGEIGLANVEYFSSVEGVPVYKDHEYELISVYNNTTDEDQDSMAVMYAYFLDQSFQGPDPSLSHLQNDDDATLSKARRRCGVAQFFGQSRQRAVLQRRRKGVRNLFCAVITTVRSRRSIARASQAP